MKQFLNISIIIVLLIAFAGCDAAEIEPAPTSTPEITSTPTLSPTQASTLAPTPSPSPSPTADPFASKTTGLYYDGEYKPVLAVIENSPAARPQTGLQTADIVYEVPVEGSITRFVCVFSDNVPEEIMPVRSGRPVFLYIQHEWDAVFMHFGGSGADKRDYVQPYSYYGHELYADIKFDVDGLKGRWNDYYHRVSEKSAPHNVMGNPKLAQELYDYDPEPLTWIFDENIVYSGQDVLEINLPLCSGQNDYVTYVYDKENDVYLRSMMGKVFKSAETGQQVSVKNVIAMYSTYDEVQGIKLWVMVGGGKAEYFIGGKLVKGRWERETVEDETVFYDDQDNEIVLKPGNTWIEISIEE